MKLQMVYDFSIDGQPEKNPILQIIYDETIFRTTDIYSSIRIEQQSGVIAITQSESLASPPERHFCLSWLHLWPEGDVL